MAHGAGRAWTAEEDRILEDGLRRGIPRRLLALRLDRTTKAIEKRLSSLRADAGYVTLSEKQIRRASDQLGQAIKKAITSFANDNRMSEQAAQTFLLGSEPVRVPGTERILKTSAIVRHLNSIASLSEAA